MGRKSVEMLPEPPVYEQDGEDPLTTSQTAGGSPGRPQTLSGEEDEREARGPGHTPERQGCQIGPYFPPNLRPTLGATLLGYGVPRGQPC